jgi:carboxyl-terminal processing protease
MTAVFAAFVVLGQEPPDFGRAWETVATGIRQTYYGRQTRKDEMERILGAAEPMARAAKGILEFDAVVDAMIAEFEDSHFDFLTRDEQGFYAFDEIMRRDRALPMPQIGAWFRPTEGGWVAAMVLEGGAAEKAGVRQGDLVVSLAGKPFSPVAALRPHIGQTVGLAWSREGRPMAGQVEVGATGAVAMFLKASRESAEVVIQEGRKVGVMRVWMLINDDFRNALSNFVYGQARDTDAFVLDLRDGFGGRPEGFADPFFRPEVKLDWTVLGTTNRQLFGYQRPLVVLVNRGSRSAKEVLAYILKTSGRATLVGTRTGGNVLGTSPRPVGDWAYLEVPMVDLTVDGKRLEDVGVPVDVEAPDGFDAAGRDLALAKAVEIAVRLAER